MQFYPLTVTHIHRETRDCVVISLEPEDAQKLDFSYKPGQYLTFKKVFEGEELRRSYSICSGVNDNQLRVGIKRVNGGWFSSWANEELDVGDIIEAMPPQGKFTPPLDADKARNYLMFAVGSGITPIISLAKSILESEPNSKIILTYVNKSFKTIIFREELSDLKDRFMTRFSILHMLKHDAGDIDVLNGKMSPEKLDQLFSTWMSPKSADMAFICGPRELLFMISDKLKEHGMDKSQIKFELFASPPPKTSKTKTETDRDKKDVQAKAIIDGQTRTFEMTRFESFLDAALEADIELPFSCKGGVCSTCCGKIISGKGEMLTNYALEDYEVERALTLTCQTRALSDEITISFDEH